MKNYIYFLLLLIFSCQNSNESDNNVETLEVEQKIEVIKENPLDSIHPNNLSQDLSWIVSLDIQEGFLLSYTITHQSGEEKTYPIDESIPIIGGVDHPEPHFVNDTTYYIPNAGSSKNGHFEIYIYQNGEAEYKEVKN